MAQRWAEAVAPQRLYLATCWAEDEEMARRVARHQDMRGAGWQCIEEPLNPAAALDVPRPFVYLRRETVPNPTQETP